MSYGHPNAHMKISKVALFSLSSFVFQAGAEEMPDAAKQPFLYEMMKGIMSLPADNFTATAKMAGHVDTSVAPDDVTLMRRMVQYSAATYCYDLTLKPWLCTHCRKLDKVDLISVESDLITGGKAMVTVDHNLKAIVVAFRGSSNIRNWVTDFNILLGDLDVGDGSQGVQVHIGFLRYANDIGAKIIPTVRMLLNKYTDYTVAVTGHSLGGAVADLASVMLKKELNIPWSKIRLVTFGAPRVGNAVYAMWMNRQSSTHLRVVNNRDKVPHIPPNVWGFIHHNREIFLDGPAMTSCVSAELEDPTCSNSRVPFLDVWDHINYLDVNFAFIC